MERILENLPMLTWQHYLFAAAVAYVITYIYRVFSRVLEHSKEKKKNGEKTYVIKTFDRQAVDRCKELFPIDVLSFKGREFKRGTQEIVNQIRSVYPMTGNDSNNPINVDEETKETNEKRTNNYYYNYFTIFS